MLTHLLALSRTIARLSSEEHNAMQKQRELERFVLDFYALL